MDETIKKNYILIVNNNKIMKRHTGNVPFSNVFETADILRKSDANGA